MSLEKFERPIEYAEKTLIQNILTGIYAIGDRLPPERELAGQLGITRPTLREAIRHLEQEGWLLVRQGKPTLIRDFWREGGLSVLSRIVQFQGYVKPSFITNLLEFRLLVAPAYTRDAVHHNPEKLLTCLAGAPALDADVATYAAFDWTVQHALTVLSGNVIFPLILNGFISFYERIANVYFQPLEARQTSHTYYDALAQATAQSDADEAHALTQQVMEASIRHWLVASAEMGQIPMVNKELLR
jgi:GntR family transcriptional regulator, negative regulator for fad regulon and positive regulator of fabA